MSKGSKRRPGDKAKFDSNYDRIFSADPFEKDNALEYGLFWDHNCKHQGFISLAKGNECDWCGAEDPDA